MFREVERGQRSSPLSRPGARTPSPMLKSTAYLPRTASSPFPATLTLYWAQLLFLAACLRLTIRIPAPAQIPRLLSSAMSSGNVIATASNCCSELLEYPESARLAMRISPSPVRKSGMKPFPGRQPNANMGVHFLANGAMVSPHLLGTLGILGALGHPSIGNACWAAGEVREVVWWPNGIGQQRGRAAVINE
jgi:hypothetical protein